MASATPESSPFKIGTFIDLKGEKFKIVDYQKPFSDFPGQYILQSTQHGHIIRAFKHELCKGDFPAQEWQDQDDFQQASQSDEELGILCIDAENKEKSSSTKKSEPTQQNSRFINFEKDDLAEFISNQENARTKQKTAQHVKLFQDYILSTKNENSEIHKINPKVLDEYLCSFFLGIRKKDQTEYEPNYLKNIQQSLERHLRKNEYEKSITDDMEFYNSRQILKAKQVDLKKKGKGNGPKTADPMDDEEINVLYEKKQLGTSSPMSIINTLWWHFTTHFGMRVNTEHYNLCWGDVALKTDITGKEYLELVNERQTKTRTGADFKNTRVLNPKIYATNGERCPIQVYKLYKSLRPANMLKPDDKFYIQSNAQFDKNGIWFKNQVIGINKIAKILPNMVKTAGIVSDKRLTNTSARKHLLTKLADHNIPDRQIMQISGHKNITSINHYAKMSRKRQNEISDILTDTNIQPALPAIFQPSTSSVTAATCGLVCATASRAVSTSVTTCMPPAGTSPQLPSFLNNCTINGPITINMNQRADGQTVTKVQRCDETVLSQSVEN